MIEPGAPTLARCEDAQHALFELDGVWEVTVSTPDCHNYGNRNKIEVVLAPGHDRAPPRVIRCLASHDLGIADVSPQGEYRVVTAI